MAERYTLTPQQAVILRSLGERVVEATPTEVAVSALLPPNEVRSALGTLVQLHLVNSWMPEAGLSGEPVFVLSNAGQAVVRALPGEGKPAVGTIARISPKLPGFLEYFSGKTPSFVEIADENQAVSSH